MSPINQKSIDEKLFKLQELVKVLEEIRGKGREAFFADQIIQDATTLNLFISIELIIDIGNHIITESFQRQAKTYAEVIKILGEMCVVPEAFAKENADMPKFRNLVAHDYDKITPDGVYDNLQKAPGIFRQFAKYFVEFMEKSAQ